MLDLKKKIFIIISVLNINDSRESGGKHMRCPFCGKENTRVIDSRPADDGDSIRRRR